MSVQSCRLTDTKDVMPPIACSPTSVTLEQPCIQAYDSLSSHVEPGSMPVHVTTSRHNCMYPWALLHMMKPMNSRGSQEVRTAMEQGAQQSSAQSVAQSSAQSRAQSSAQSSAQHSTAQNSTAQHSTAQHSTAQHSILAGPSI